MRNIGPWSRERLDQIGVTTAEDIDRLGTVRVFLLVREIEPSVSKNLLWALEGARRGIDWRVLEPETRAALEQELTAS